MHWERTIPTCFCLLWGACRKKRGSGERQGRYRNELRNKVSCQVSKLSKHRSYFLASEWVVVCFDDWAGDWAEITEIRKLGLR